MKNERIGKMMFDIRKIFAVSKDFLKSKNYSMQSFYSEVIYDILIQNWREGIKIAKNQIALKKKRALFR